MGMGAKTVTTDIGTDHIYVDPVGLGMAVVPEVVKVMLIVLVNFVPPGFIVLCAKGGRDPAGDDHDVESVINSAFAFDFNFSDR